MLPHSQNHLILNLLLVWHRAICRQSLQDLQALLILLEEPLSRNLTTLLEVHKVDLDFEVLHLERRKETLVRARRRDLKDLPVLVTRLVLLAELDRVAALRLVLLQVEDDEVLVLVDGEELTQPSSEAGLRVLVDWGVFPCPIFLEIQLTPFNLGDCGTARLIPDCQRCGVLFVE